MSTQPPIPPSNISYAVVTIVLNVYLITTTGCILFFRSTPLIRAREPLLTFISASCGIVVFNFLWDFQQIFSDGSLCLPLLLLLHSILPLVLFCYIMRIFYVILAYHLHHLGTNKAVRNKRDTKFVLADKSVVQNILLRIGRCLINTQTDKVAISEVPILLAGFKTWQLLKSILCLVVLEAVVFIITILSSKSDRVRYLQASIHQCEAHTEVFSVLGLYFAFTMVAITGMLFRLWKIRDQVYTKFEMSIVVLIVIGIFAVCIISMVNNTATEIRLLKYHFVAASMLALHTLSVTFPLTYLLSKKIFVKNPVSRANFDKVLQSPALFSSFKAHLEENHCSESGLFYEQYLVIEDLLQKLNLTHTTAKKPGPEWSAKDPAIQAYTPEVRRLITNLFRKFVAPCAPLGLNIRGAVIAMAKDCISETGTLTPSILELIRRDVYDMMFSNAFPKFVEKYPTSVA